MKLPKNGSIAISNRLAASSIQSFIARTAKANGLYPYEYLRYIFKYLPGVCFKEEPEFLEDFLPWNPEVQAFFNKAEKLIYGNHISAFSMHCLV